ncbi:MAG: asparagine synthetase B, partial [Vicingaceae bacterium]
MNFKKLIFLILIAFATLPAVASYILIPMDESQKNHLKAYGVAYWVLERDVEVDWLLNYRGGSFMVKNAQAIVDELNIRGVSYELIPNAKSTAILTEIANPEVNMDVVKLQKPPKMAVYSPKSKLPWDDAVTLVLTYAEIPYTVIYDKEVIQGELPQYDWLHLHHEDFTGQYGRFYGSYRNHAWYKEEVRSNEAMAEELGFSKVSELKLAVAKRIKEFTIGGGFLFSMCSGTDSYDIALAASEVDICEQMFDGDGTTPNYNSKLNYNNTFAFKDFTLKTNPMEYEFSNIDATPYHVKTPENRDKFTLFEFSAKWDPIPTMLCQNHSQIIDGFMGQTTAYDKRFIKKDVLIMGETKSLNSARYIHGEFGKGTWTFYGGHDPEDYQHFVGDPPTDLNL